MGNNTISVDKIGHFSFDNMIVYGFLLIILAVGIYAGRKVKDIKDYSIANKKYGTGILLLTLLATGIGGGSSAGLAASIYSHGIITILMFVGIILSILLVGFFVIPKIISFKENELSMADIIGRFYGNEAKFLTGILGCLYSTAIVAMQIMAMGILSESLLGTNKLTGILLSGGILVAYTSFGGIKSVTITDVLEFIILIVVMPIIANIIVSKAGGISTLFTNLPPAKLQILGHEKLIYYSILFFLHLLPTYSLEPTSVQRILMSRNRTQIKKIFFIQAGVNTVFYIMIVFIGLAAISLYPDIKANNTLPYIIKEAVPTGLRGFAIAGLFAVIMSSGDSFLNTGGIFFSRNIISPISTKLKIKINELELAKYSSLIIGLCAMTIAYLGDDILKVKFYVLGIFSPIITIPFVSALIGIKGDKKTFFIATISAVISFIISIIILSKPYRPLGILISIITNAITFFSYHFYKNKKLLFIKQSFSKEQELKGGTRWSYLRNKILKILPTPKNIYKYTVETIRRYGSNHIVFGAFFCLNYLVPIFMWSYGETPHHTLMIILRFIGGMFCVGLILEKRWPWQLKKFFPIYWYISLTFCLPFLSTTMYMLMGGTTEWLINIALTIMLLACLVDWKTFLILLVLGTISGTILGYSVIGDSHTIFQIINCNDFSSIYLLVYTCAFSCLVGLVFFRKKENDVQKKLSTLKILGGAIAHEVNNVIGTDTSSSMLLEMLFRSILIKKENKTTEEDGKTQNELLLSTNKETYDSILKSIKQIGSGSRKGLEIIKRIIVNMTKEIKGVDFEITSISECINNSIEKYGMTEIQKKNLTIEIKDNFNFKGSEYYVKHVLFNLIRNAYKYSREDCKINIWTHNNKLFIKDNGPGISKENLPYIFDYFYTTSTTGAGIGLSFSKLVMEKLGGDIFCKTQTGNNSYTTFILKFPKLID